MKYKEIIEKYSNKAVQSGLSPIKALSYLSALDEICGECQEYQTVLFEIKQIWISRFMAEDCKMNEEYGYVKDLLFGLQRIFIDNDTLLKYGHYEIGYMPHADWLRYCDMIVARLCHDTDNETSKIIAKNEEVMQAFCWGAVQAFKRREQTLKGE